MVVSSYKLEDILKNQVFSACEFCTVYFSNMSAKKFLELPGGAKIPSVGLGTWQAMNEVQLEAALNTALEVGYRHIDTAFIYQNESIIGKVLQKWFASGRLKREDIFITTKLPPQGMHPDRVEMFLDRSLKALGLEYVDLYLIHLPIALKYVDVQGMKFIDKEKNTVRNPEFEYTDHLDVWKKMEELVDAGKSRTIGLSNFNKNQIDRILKNSRIQPASLQVELHVYLQQKELVEFCQQNNIVVVAYAPLGSPGYNVAITKVGLEPKQLPDLLNEKTVKKIAVKHKKTTAQVLLRFLLQKNIVVIPKSVKPERVKENFNVYNFSLDAADMKALTDLDLGESGRISDMKIAGFVDHPEYPFPK